MNDVLLLHKTLLAKELTLSVAESLTSGLLQDMVGANSGASKFFKGGLTAYGLEQKTQILGVEATHAAEVDCVSEQVAREMAIGVRKLFNSSVSIATTGYAEVYEEMNITSPFAYIAISYLDELLVVRIDVESELSRNEVRETVATQAISLLVSHLN
ncbi:CinA family protein [Vibrio parahaemolyticus]|uniref:CinA family protein n=2 Tax=Vibrio parahaemolyticus TaxID=670 RepID=UPI0007A04EEC|nr:nicotinamide-nucleotide amidohydrolase family protein [Vibrio parahaemolyticus]EGQ7737606.1 nicotinamide-nucleotide amidohydrolase family protein [Vibrio parahaemolyticus]EGR1584007.1 nicotinamide-nucleotide amidohydrolase family protein [Vibrio parahaemolyticus]EHZ7318781.1 nicotinamide-nucleotide amidohydrolase family protein [Vibrio parahaemolyticus]EIA4664304.1 nicotinamide-nucleotide amidohydrolase family protein [Vibrio parahaemolyticus]EIC2729405.1 nicotinamide-nucleotide amidohydrol